MRVPTDYEEFIEKAGDYILEQQEQTLGCWVFGDVASDSIPSPWITAEAVFNLISSQYVQPTDPSILRGIDYLEARFCTVEEADDTGGWCWHDHIDQIWTEPTLWAVRSLIVCKPSSIFIPKALRWIVENQNEDGGWGSFKGQVSRTYPTAFTVIMSCECLNLPSLSAGLAQTLKDRTQRGVEWLKRTYDQDAGAWGESPDGNINHASTAHAVLALIQVPNEFGPSWIESGASKILRFLVSRLHGDEWGREVESYVIKQDQQLQIQRVLWAGTNHCCAALFLLAVRSDCLVDYISYILAVEGRVMSSLPKVAKQPLFELGQAIWLIRLISPRLRNEYFDEHLRELTETPMLVVARGWYLSLRFGVFIVIILNIIVMYYVVQDQNDRFASLALLVASAISYLIVEAIVKYRIFSHKIIKSRVASVALYVAQLVVVWYAIQHFLGTVVGVTSTSAAVGAAIALALGLVAEEYFKDVFKRILQF